MNYQIKTTDEQEMALKRLGLSVQQIVAERLDPIVGSIDAERATNLLNAEQSATPEEQAQIADILNLDPKDLTPVADVPVDAQPIDANQEITP